jgi:primosomal protein N' (replication factor Y)
MYIVSILVEHPVHALDTTFDYLADQEVSKGVRVQIRFASQLLIGYVMGCQQTMDTKEELEKKHGYKYRYIESVIDEKSLLNEELQALSIDVSKLTLAPRIACLQAMLPPQLKPNSSKGVAIKYVRKPSVIDAGVRCQTKKQQEALDFLIDNPSILMKEVPYSDVVLSKLVEQKAITIEQVESYRNPYQYHNEQVPLHSLTKMQQEVVNGILGSLGTCQTSLIHGVTGSGKTEVYLHLAKYVVSNDKTVIILVPEISLTPMMVKAFKQQFDDQVAILHSRLSMGERYDEYRRITQGDVKIVVGARSAVFAPLTDIGMIILDEEHDASYKQESTPKYHTLQIARMRASYHQCPVVLGSATPSLESYSRSQKGIYKLYELPNRINQKPLPKMTLIDMAEEIRNRNYSLFSSKMKEALQETLNRNEQVILLLNKRGYASYVRCLDCGEVITCPNCDVTLTYHKDEHKMRCHYCEYETRFISECPHCHGHRIKLVGSGTQKIEEIIGKTFINAKVIRYDVDTTKHKGSHEKLLQRFENQEANILLGTQMIAKGLDFPKVTFVGVLNADISLHIPDFRANERTFQLLSQVAGRSGRGMYEGQVMIQTYNPDHFVLQCVKEHNYQRFYQEEVKYRQMAKYPPFMHLVSILIEGKKEDEVEQTSFQIKEYLQKQLPQGIILGPANSVIYMMKNQYRKRILIKFTNGKEVHAVLSKMQDFYNKERHAKVLVTCDFNPFSQM